MLDRPTHREQFVWTDATVDLLRELWAQGKSAADCAAIIGEGVTRSAITGKVTRLKLPKRETAAPAGRPSLGKSALRQQSPKREPEALVKLPFVADPLPLRAAAWEPLEGSKPISLMDLPDRPGVLCRWPVTGGYCGLPSGERTYCDHHHTMAFRAKTDGEMRTEKNIRKVGL